VKVCWKTKNSSEKTEKRRYVINILETTVKDVYILEPKVFGDHRGWFMETWSKREMEAAGFYYDFVQDNHAYSTKKGTIRGLHFQKGEASQAKLVRCVRGAILDVAVDIRKSSPTFGKWVATELSAENKRMLLVPRGFAHGYATLTDEVDFLYKVDNAYCPQAERGIRWNDPKLNIEWGIENPVLLDRDANAPLLADMMEELFT